MKKLRKISALILALALICALAANVLAATVTEDEIRCGSVVYTAKLTGTSNSATATVKIENYDQLSSSYYFSGSIELHYVSCDEAIMRPSNYTHASVTRSFTRYDFTYSNGYSISRGVTCSSGKVMIEASADYEMVAQITSNTTTTNNTVLSMELY